MGRSGVQNVTETGPVVRRNLDAIKLGLKPL
jgi:hypothetical protein